MKVFELITRTKHNGVYLGMDNYFDLPPYARLPILGARTAYGVVLPRVVPWPCKRGAHRDPVAAFGLEH